VLMSDKNPEYRQCEKVWFCWDGNPSSGVKHYGFFKDRNQPKVTECGFWMLSKCVFDYSGTRSVALYGVPCCKTDHVCKKKSYLKINQHILPIMSILHISLKIISCPKMSWGCSSVYNALGMSPVLKRKEGGERERERERERRQEY